jgi:hypothetical protein
LCHGAYLHWFGACDKGRTMVDKGTGWWAATLMAQDAIGTSGKNLGLLGSPRILHCDADLEFGLEALDEDL